MAAYATACILTKGEIVSFPEKSVVKQYFRVKHFKCENGDFFTAFFSIIAPEIGEIFN